MEQTSDGVANVFSVTDALVELLLPTDQLSLFDKNNTMSQLVIFVCVYSDIKCVMTHELI